MDTIKETPEDNLPEQETEVTPPAETTETPKPERRTIPAQPKSMVLTEGTSGDPCEWRDWRTGKEIRVLSHDQKFTDLHRGSEPLSLGRAVRATRLTRLDASKNPKELDLSLDPTELLSSGISFKRTKGGTTTGKMLGIYQLDGNKLTWCLAVLSVTTFWTFRARTRHLGPAAVESGVS